MAKGTHLNSDGFRNYRCSCGDYLETGAQGLPNEVGKRHNEGKTGEVCSKCGEVGFTGQTGFTKRPKQEPRPKITHHNAPFGEVGLDSNFNPPGYNEFHKTHDYIPPCDQFPGGTWLIKENEELYK